jgi:hypothetical protein
MQQLVSGAGAAALRNVGNITAAAGSIINDAQSSFLGAVFRSNAVEQAAAGVGSAIGSLFPAEQITSAVQQASGLAPNPNPSIAFQGPVLRDFSYTWAFYPKSKEESEAIDRLIKILKRRALPKNWANKSAAILEYPDMCQLNFYPWDTGGVAPWFWSNNSILRYKKCVMQGVNANYNPFGTPAFFEGSNLPVSYQLTISFREIEYMLSHDWESVELGPLGDGAITDENVVQGITTRTATGAANLNRAPEVATAVAGAVAGIGISTGTVAPN